MKYFLLYKFTSAICNSSYIGETCRHFKLGLRNKSKKITNLIFLIIYIKDDSEPYQTSEMEVIAKVVNG